MKISERLRNVALSRKAGIPAKPPKQIGDFIVKMAEKMFLANGELSRAQDMLQDLHDDATGLTNKGGFYHDAKLKQLKTNMLELHNQIIRVIDDVEHYAKSTLQKAG